MLRLQEEHFIGAAERRRQIVLADAHFHGVRARLQHGENARGTAYFTAQRLQRRFIEFQFANLMTPDFALAQRRQRLLLLPGAFQTVKVDNLPLLGGEPVPQRRGAGGFALAQHNG